MNNQSPLEQLIGFIVKHRRLLLVFSILLITLIVTLSLISHFTTQNNQQQSHEQFNVEGAVTPNNLSQYQEHTPPQEFLDYLSQDLYRTINYNSDQIIPDDNITDAVVREGSFTETYNRKTQTYTVKYLVDLPSLQQSYLVKYNWSPDPHSTITPAPSTYCPTPKQLAYEEFDCRDYYILQTDDTTTRYATYADRFIVYLTPYLGTLEDGSTFRATRQFDSNDLPYIEITFNTCDAGNLVEYAKSVLSTYANSLDLDLSDFRVRATILKCDY